MRSNVFIPNFNEISLFEVWNRDFHIEFILRPKEGITKIGFYGNDDSNILELFERMSKNIINNRFKKTENGYGGIVYITEPLDFPTEGEMREIYYILSNIEFFYENKDNKDSIGILELSRKFVDDWNKIYPGFNE